MVTLRIILILLAFVILFILGWQNQCPVSEVRVFFRTFYDVPIALVMLYSFAFGGLCVGIFTIISEIRLRARLRRQRHEIDALTEELRALRNAPLSVIAETEKNEPAQEKEED
ncbi:MAG: lipopolysaccharide assembly protein LapA domain-containing protein [candidate division WOR-3 bacterium]